MRRLLAVLVILASITIGAAAAKTTANVPLCRTEDSTNCRWDAQLQGNGEGRSFVNIDGVTYYAP